MTTRTGIHAAPTTAVLQSLDDTLDTFTLDLQTPTVIACDVNGHYVNSGRTEVTFFVQPSDLPALALLLTKLAQQAQDLADEHVHQRHRTGEPADAGVPA